MTTIGYLRVSTKDQDLEKNKTDILRLAHEKDLGKVVFEEEKISGVKNWRHRKLGEVLDSLNSGDTLIVSELSRLGRSTLQVLEIIEEAKRKGINVYSVKGPWALNGTMESKILLNVFAMVSEIERDLISERTKEALRARKAEGVVLGRPRGPGKSMLDKHREEIIALLRNGSTKSFVAERYGTSSANLAHWIKMRDLDVRPRPERPPEQPKQSGEADETLPQRTLV
jgi:DNA invertase Pin-like site-specific DNA recombinase